MKLAQVFCVAAVVACAAAASASPINYSVSGNVVNENFDTLASGGTNPLAWANDSTLPAWSLFGYAGTAITTYRFDNGGSNTGTFNSYGTTAATERALGGAGSSGTYFGTPGPASGAVAGYIAVAITNNTGGALTDFTVGFDGEQWRNGGNASAQTMVLEYGFGATFGAVAAWTAPGGNFDWASPVVGTTAAAVDGNVAGLVAGKGGTVGSQTWADGDTLWIRWIERNDAGNDHGLAIDNFSFSATPEPGTIGMLAIGAIALIRRRR